MEFDKIKEVWQAEAVLALPDRANQEIMNVITARLGKIHQTIRWRDVREIGAAIVSILLFGAWFWTVPSVISRSGAAVVVAGSMLIIARLSWAHRRARQAESGLTMREFCAAERDRIDAQIRLLQSTLWWYLGPTLLGTNLFVFGFTGFNAWGIGFLAVTLILGLILYRLNMAAARLRLLPVKNELEQLLAEIEKDTCLPAKIPDSHIPGGSI